MDQEGLTRLASLPKKLFDVFIAELKSFGVVDVCESQSHADILSRAHSHCSDLVVSQLLSRIDCFVRNDIVEDVYVEFDKLDPVESMRVLKDLFESLRDELVKQTSDNLSAGDVRRVVQDYLKKLMPNARAHHSAKLENTHTVEKILNNLIQDGFCSHLDCKILIAAIKELPRDTEDVEGTVHDDQDTTELVQLLQSYQDNHKSFCKEITLGVLRDTLVSNSDLKPNKSVGTPFLVFRLSYPWVNLRYHTALSVLTSILPLVSDLQLQAVEGTSDTILLVFCGFEAPLISLFNDHLQNPEVMEGLRELKIVPRVESAEQPILAERQLPTDVSPEAPGTDHTDQNDEQRKQKQVLYENVHLQDTSETTLLLELKEMVSSMRKTNYEVEEEKYSFKKETKDIRTKYDAEMMTMHKELEKFINEAAKHREEIASLKRELDASRTQEARQEKEALQKQASSLHELLKQELERLHKDGIKTKEEAEEMHKQLVNENSFLHEKLAQLNQHVEELTKQHAESSLRNDELKQKLLKKKTVIEQFSGGYSKLADQLKEMRETHATELQEKDLEITRLEMLVNENSFLREKLAQLNQHVEELTKQHAESSLRNDELKQELLKKNTVIDGGYSKLADQLKEMRETHATELREKDLEITHLEMLVNENSFLCEKLAQLNQHVEELTKQHAESSLRNDELKQELLKKNTVIDGGYSKLADQLKEMRETHATELQEKDLEITHLEMLLRCPQNQPRVPHEEDHLIHGSTTTLSPNVTPNPSPNVSPEDSLSNGVYSVAQAEDTAGHNVTHSACVTNNT